MIPYLPCYAILDSQTMEVIDLTWMCGRSLSTPIPITDKPVLTDREKVLLDIATEYNDIFCATLAKDGKDAAIDAAIAETRQIRQDVFEDWGISSGEVVLKAQDVRECPH